MADHPQSDDPLVQALQRLLSREGGHIAVGHVARVSDQSLYQIAFCKPDAKTGKPKGVGPSIRKRLDTAFPGWLTAAPHPASPQQAPVALEAALERLGIALALVPPDMREAVATNLAGWARDGGQGPWSALVQHLLQAPPTKRPNAA